MAIRCPTAIPIGPKKIHGYRLQFRMHLDIVKSDPDDYVWGGCWQIDEEAEAILDQIEGYPYYYGKIDIDGMLVYQMTNKHYDHFDPDPDYVKMVREGLTDFGLPPDMLERNLGKEQWLLHCMNNLFYDHIRNSGLDPDSVTNDQKIKFIQNFINRKNQCEQ